MLILGTQFMYVSSQQLSDRSLLHRRKVRHYRACNEINFFCRFLSTAAKATLNRCQLWANRKKSHHPIHKKGCNPRRNNSNKTPFSRSCTTTAVMDENDRGDTAQRMSHGPIDRPFIGSISEHWRGSEGGLTTGYLDPSGIFDTDPISSPFVSLCRG